MDRSHSPTQVAIGGHRLIPSCHPCPRWLLIPRAMASHRRCLPWDHRAQHTRNISSVLRIQAMRNPRPRCIILPTHNPLMFMPLRVLNCKTPCRGLRPRHDQSYHRLLACICHLIALYSTLDRRSLHLKAITWLTNLRRLMLSLIDRRSDVLPRISGHHHLRTHHKDLTRPGITLLSLLTRLTRIRECRINHSRALKRLAMHLSRQINLNGPVVSFHPSRWTLRNQAKPSGSPMYSSPIQHKARRHKLPFRRSISALLILNHRIVKLLLRHRERLRSSLSSSRTFWLALPRHRDRSREIRGLCGRMRAVQHHHSYLIDRKPNHLVQCKDEQVQSRPFTPRMYGMRAVRNPTSS